ncbi:LytR C-terminal domain-containing protein [Bifidobacterium breve]|uniref:LytR C-terminal domain-containing protein n=1 Tax=Bifidobacterium breve TaxID=1685 RepID=UPI00068152AB|nr:LytR C-terminal domain-containing protein [Bifidobacterium breve]KND52445.1 cell wall integrity and stress response protein 1 [Bifidobacterium breve]
MARDKVTYESYEQDVFDNPPKGPVGVHRGPRSVISRIAPFVIVILVAALCGFGAWAWVTGEYKNILNLNTSSQTAQTSGTEKKDSSDTKSENTDSSNAQSDSAATDNADQSAQQDQAAATVNKATQVRVINATGISGYAGQKADVLQIAGYTSVEAANPTGAVPTSTVVWYQNEADKATAEDVASTLGISAVEQVQGLAAPITVVLLN